MKLSQVTGISQVNFMIYLSGVWFDNMQKMGSGPGSPFGLEDKAPWTSWMFNFEGFTDSPHPHRQETRGLDTTQVTAFIPWWLYIFLLSRKSWGKGRFVKTPEKSLKKQCCTIIQLPLCHPPCMVYIKIRADQNQNRLSTGHGIGVWRWTQWPYHVGYYFQSLS